MSTHSRLLTLGGFKGSAWLRSEPVNRQLAELVYFRAHILSSVAILEGICRKLAIFLLQSFVGVCFNIFFTASTFDFQVLSIRYSRFLYRLSARLSLVASFRRLQFREHIQR